MDIEDFNLENCTSKDELETYALAMFGADLDKRKKLEQLKDEVRALAIKPQTTESETVGLGTPANQAVSYQAPKFYVKNKYGAVFLKTSLTRKFMAKGVSGLVDCDQYGNPV